MSRGWAVTAIVIAVVVLILAPSKREKPKPWQDAAWDIYDEIASGPADDDLPSMVRPGDGPY